MVISIDSMLIKQLGKLLNVIPGFALLCDKTKDGFNSILPIVSFWPISQQFALTHFFHFFQINLLIPNMYYILLTQSNLQSKGLVTMSVSLHTQTALHCLTIQVLNTRVWFLAIWCTSLISIHYNLEHGLVIITENFSPLNLDYTTSLVKVWIRSDITSHAIPFCHAYQLLVRTSFS